jgi:D-amino-acid dehydrogenase
MEEGMASVQRVLVLGGGVVGVTSAYYLNQRGFHVTLVERRPEVGLETSFANGSLITPSMSDPWAAPGLPWKILKWIGREDSPFLLRARALPGLLSWGLRFLGCCDEATWRRNTGTILRIARHSQNALDALSEETGIRYDRSRRGTLRLFRDPLSMENAKRSAEVVGAHGVAYTMLDRDGCQQLEPALTPQIGKISGGIHFPEDDSGDAFKFTQALAELCGREGVEFRYGVSVQGLEADGDAISGVRTDGETLTADRYLVALGNGSAPLLRGLGIRLPIYPVKGYSATLATEGWNNAPRVPMVDDGRKIGIVPLGDRLRVAGTAEFGGYDTALNPQRGATLIENLRELFPDCPNQESAEHWTGLRPTTPDGIPILGTTPYSNLYLNAGHGHLGWTLSCGSAEALADLMAGRRPGFELDGMTLDRF